MDSTLITGYTGPFSPDKVLVRHELLKAVKGSLFGPVISGELSVAYVKACTGQKVVLSPTAEKAVRDWLSLNEETILADFRQR